MSYDIIYIGEKTEQWDILKNRYPTAKHARSFTAAQKMAMTKMFWAVWDDIIVDQDFNFSSRLEDWEEKQDFVRVFKNGDNYDGIVLCNKRQQISEREASYRFFTKKKEIDIQASVPRPYDVVFISYNEINAEENYQALLTKAPAAKRVHGVKGIHQAHIEAAKQCSTEMFWVVDGDAEIVPEFVFDYYVPKWERDTVHVWRSKNPVNGLEYGYGGVKLLPTELTKAVDVSAPDMTTSISHKFKAVNEVSNVTAFNTDEFSTWRSAFRECAKLASKSLRGQIDEETQQRLDAWCNTDPDFAPYSAYARRGAIHGCEFGLSAESSVQLGKINDFDWLYEIFLEENKTSE